MNWTNARNWVAIAVILVATGPMYFLTLRAGHNWGGDFAVYLQQGRNLVAGAPLYETDYVVTERSARNHPAAYPPLPSVVLAPWLTEAEEDFLVLKRVLTCFLWVGLGFWYLIAREAGLNWIAAMAATLTFGFAAILEPVRDMVGSDGLYLFTSGGALALLLWANRSGWLDRWPVLAGLVASGVLLMNYGTRASALALIGATIAWEVMAHRGRRRFGWILMGLVAVGLISYNAWIYEGAQQYGSQFKFDAGLYARNAVFYLRAAAPIWSGAPQLVRYTLAGATLLLVVAGMVRRWRKPGLLDWYVAVSFAMLVGYTVNNDFRYAVPLLPVLLILAAGELGVVLEQWAPEWMGSKLAVAVGVIALGATAWNLRFIEKGPLGFGVDTPEFRQLRQYLKTTSEETLLLSWNPRLLSYYGRRPSALHPQWTGTQSEFERQIPAGLGAGGILLVVYEAESEAVREIVAKSAANWKQEYARGEFVVYRVR